MNVVGRVIATAAIWIVGTVGLGYLVSQFSVPAYEMVQQFAPGFEGTTMDPFMVPMMTGFEYAPMNMVIVLALLAFALIVGMTASTLGLWKAASWISPKEGAGAAGQTSHPADAHTSEKVKRDQQARLQRLLERMEADDLAALEHHLTALENQVSISSDGELIGMDAMPYDQRTRRRG